MPTFRPLAESTDAPALALFREVLMEHHPEFLKYKALIRLFFAHATRDKKTGDPKGPAIRADRNNAAAYKAEAHQHAARVKGSADASITLDGDEWDGWSDARQRAILDEALRELEFVWEEDGPNATVALDDQGRPRMRKSIPDVTVRVWYDVAERGGDLSSAVMALRSLRRPFVQLVFDFAPPRDPPAERGGTPGTTTVTFDAEMGRNAAAHLDRLAGAAG